MSGRDPLVSIGLPVYNGERYLARALDSLLSQEFEAFELIVSDNASTDGTAEICREYAGRDSRVRYHRNERNVGAVGNFNRTLSLASGRYFKWAAHDDWCASDFLGRCVDVLDRDADTVLCFTDMAVADASGRVFRYNRERLAGAASPNPAVRFHHVLWKLTDCTSPVFGLMRTDAVRAVGGLPNAPELDRVLIGAMSLEGRIRIIHEPLFFHHGPPGHPKRDQWTWMNPSNANRFRLATIRITQIHLAAVWAADLSLADKLYLSSDVLAAFGINRTRSKLRKLWRSRFGAGRTSAGQGRAA